MYGITPYMSTVNEQRLPSQRERYHDRRRRRHPPAARAELHLHRQGQQEEALPIGPGRELDPRQQRQVDEPVELLVADQPAGDHIGPEPSAHSAPEHDAGLSAIRDGAHADGRRETPLGLPRLAELSLKSGVREL